MHQHPMKHSSLFASRGCIWHSSQPRGEADEDSPTLDRLSLSVGNGCRKRQGNRREEESKNGFRPPEVERHSPMVVGFVLYGMTFLSGRGWLV